MVVPVTVTVDGTYLRTVVVTCATVSRTGVVQRITHLLHLILDGRTCQTNIQTEVLVELVVVAESKLKALVLNLTIVGVDLCVTGCRTNLLIEEQVLGILNEVVQSNIPVVQECEVDTEVQHLSGLPLQVGINQVGEPTCYTLTVTTECTSDTILSVEFVCSVTIVRVQGCNGLTLDITSVTGLTPTHTEFQVVDSLDVLHERLLADTPSTCY